MRPRSEFDGTHLGKYRLIDRIGSGGMAEVYSARHEGEAGFTKDLVIKMILPGFADQPKFIEMFLNEAKLAAQLTHPNIVQIFDFGSHSGRHFLAMEFVRGLTLRKICSLVQAAEEPIPVRIAARILCGAAKGLHYAHELADENDVPLGIIHRDVSPDNIIVSRDGIPKLLDFGIAKATTVASATTQGNLKGKYPYMSPELVLGHAVDRRMDVYALGVMLYELVTGGKPFSGDDTQVLQLLRQITEEDPPRLSESRSDVPEELEQIVRKAMAKKPEDRYSTAREMYVALENFLSNSGDAVLEHHISEFLEHVVEKTGDLDVAFSRPFNTPISDILDEIDASGPLVDEPRVISRTALMTPSRNKVPWVNVVIAALLVVLAGLGVMLYLKKNPAVPVAAGPKASEVPIVAPVVVPKEPESEFSVGEVLDAETSEPDAGVEKLVVTDPKVPKDPKVPTDPKVTKDPKNPRTGGFANLSVRSSPYCTLYVDDKKVGDTPISSFQVKAGRRKLRCVNNDQGLERSTTVTLAAGESKSETFRFNKGKLVIRVKPWGEVWVDGVRKGVTPLGEISVFEGSHKIKAVNKDLNVTRTVRARVGSGETTQVKIDLTEK